MFDLISYGVGMMTENISAFDKFIRESVEQYLQTVVLIDDRIYESKGGGVTEHLTKPTSGFRKSALKSVETASGMKSASEKKIEDVDKPDEVSFHDVQNSFAQKRIICSLYQPIKGALFGSGSEVYNLCSSADVVVIDWDLHGDPGKKATELVGTLIENSMKEIPNQLRLVLIYTMDPNLGSVANDVFENLTKRLGPDAVQVDPANKGLVLKTDNARVVVFGKREQTTFAQFANFYVQEKDLAERTIKEFSKLASGLLQAIVLQGIASLRENNRRILMRFHGLDEAFLAHRSLLLPDEAFRQIIPLLTDELRAVLEDTLGECPLGAYPEVERIVSDWCTNNWKPGDDALEFVGQSVDPHEFAKEVFCKGASIKEKYSKYQEGKIPKLVASIKDLDGHLRWVNDQRCLDLAAFLSAGCKGDSCHQQLGSLMSQRIKYQKAQRSLHLGVIVREMNDKHRFLLCLQPVCDSVRLSGKTAAFIFCCLDIPKNGQPITHTVISIKNETIQLHCFLF